MKKRLFIFGMVAVWFLNLLPVKADTVTGSNSDFYTEHADECVSNNRTYSAIGPDGQVDVCVSPEDATVVDALANGVNVTVSYTYIDGESNMWGLVENADNKEKTGWVLMSYMRVIFDDSALGKVNNMLIEESVGVLEDKYLGSTIIFWDFPGVNDVLQTNLAADGELPQYSKICVDEAGYKWGYVADFGGVKEKWVCLDNPCASLAELYPEGAPDRGVESIPKEKGESNVALEDTSVVQEEQGEVETQNSKTPIFLIGGVIASVAIVAGGLLVWFKKR